MSLVLHALEAPGTGVAVAAAMGCSESTISRLKNDHTQQVLTLLSHLGLKVVPADMKCVDKAAYEFLVRSHTRVMTTAPQLIWDADEN